MKFNNLLFTIGCFVLFSAISTVCNAATYKFGIHMWGAVCSHITTIQGHEYMTADDFTEAGDSFTELLWCQLNTNPSPLNITSDLDGSDFWITLNNHKITYRITKEATDTGYGGYCAEVYQSPHAFCQIDSGIEPGVYLNMYDEYYWTGSSSPQNTHRMRIYFCDNKTYPCYFPVGFKI